MTVYKDALANLTTNEVSTWYRFQGGNSFEHMNIREKNPFSSCNGFVYFSKNSSHHRYFISKRLKQIINEVLREDSELVLTKRSLLEQKNYEKIRDVIANHELKNMSSIKIIYARPFEDLVNQNFVFNHDKKGYTRIPERVDRRKSSGGYGLPKEWLNLLDHLSIMTLDKTITTRNILRYLETVRSNLVPYAPKKDVTAFLDDELYRMKLSESVTNPFNKYNILEDLEIILEQGLCLPNSDLSKYPKETISEIITFYQLLREKLVEELEKSYERNYIK